MEMSNKIIVFAGPTGCGKSTIIAEILGSSENNVRLVTATTRSLRKGEKDGVDYYFLSRDEFLKNIKEGKIPEHNEHAGDLYGTYLPDLDNKLDEGKNILIQVQLKGAKFFKENYKAILIFINGDSLEILEDRIRTRSKLKEENIVKRIEIAKREILEESSYYDYIIINKQGDLDNTVLRIRQILLDEGVEL
jgi:guanylate kinase